jgi:Icc-related predicted phosphoesterase
LRILATADFHGNRLAFERVAAKAEHCEVELMIVCGDITHFGSLEQAKDLLSIIGTSDAFFVPGNCDPPDLGEERVGKMESIHGKCRRFGEIAFLGAGGSSPSPFDTPFELTEVGIARILEVSLASCPNETEMVLVSHSPPAGTKVDVASTGEHVGSLSIRKFIENSKPKLVVCGHIHEARGMDKINGSYVVNPGPAGRGHCALVDVDHDVKVEFDML